MKKVYPEFAYIFYGETDDFAHEGNYEAYLKSANATKTLIKQLWDFTQKDSFYKNNTIFIISTDYGRGSEPKETWRDYGLGVNGADQVWLIVFGNGVEKQGELKSKEQLYSNQIAPTILQFFDNTLKDTQMKGLPLKIIKK